MDNDSISGFKKLDNTKGFTTDQLFEELKKVNFSFGVPQMGQMLNKPAATWSIGSYTVYAQADEKFIKLGGVITQDIGKNLLKQIGIGLLTGNLAGGKDNAESDRAVEELYGVVTKLLGGAAAEKIESNVSTGYEKSFYMKQKVFSIKANYNIYLEDETPEYSVTSDITHLNFSVKKHEQEVLKLKKKLIALLPEYSLFKGDQEIGHFKKKLKLTKPEVVGQLNGKEVHVKGDLMGYNFAIEIDGMVMATVDTAVLTWGDCYRIKVRDPELEDYIIALAIIVDHVVNQEQSD